MNITCQEVRIDKEQKYISVGSIKILSIPHLSILSPNNDLQNVLEKQKKSFEKIFNEIYEKFNRETIKNDICFEILFKTKKIENQSYKADIDIYLVVKCIESQLNQSKSIVEVILNSLKTMLTIDNYELSEVLEKEYADINEKILNSKIRLIYKKMDIENLQNIYMQNCFSWGIFNSKNDLSEIINTIINYPDTMILFQIMPTSYSSEEKSTLNIISQKLSTLGQGVMEHGIGNVSYFLAKNQAEIYNHYSNNYSNPLFLYNIILIADEKALMDVESQITNMLSSSEEKFVSLKKLDINLKSTLNPLMLPWMINEYYIKTEINRSKSLVINQNIDNIYNSIYRLPFILTMSEATSIIKLPIGSDSINAGLNINKIRIGEKKYTDNLINSGDIEIGKLKALSGNQKIGLSLNDFTKHMLVVGTPGSGKTTFSVGLLDRLWKNYKIPFLVIEPAKNEYRALIQSIPDIQIFTPGKNSISPFIFNPFVPPKNVKLETYKSTLKTAFAAGVSMSSPLDKIFEETINNCYSDFKWLDTYTIDDDAQIFNIDDFIKCFQETFDEIGYTGDAKNIGRAGLVRLKSLINLFDNYFSIPIEDLLKKPTIIELAAIENSDQKALIISLVLLSILSYVNSNYIGEGNLKNLILLEEAHVLLDSDSNKGEGEANPSAIAKGLLKRMLAEIRSYGVSIVIADQSPRKVSTDVVALTDIKMVFRLVENEDKQIISNSTNMSDIQVNRLSRLKPGEAYLFFNKLEEPEEIITENYRLENKISISLSDDTIKNLGKYWSNKLDKLKPYPQCKYCKYCTHGCDYSRRLLAKEVTRRIFRKKFNKQSKFETLKETLFNLATLVKGELNKENLTYELIDCVKLHLLRKVKYEINLNISEKTFINLLGYKKDL